MAEDKFGLLGHEIDQLRFDAVVDQGGFGLVYRGHHVGLDEPVAIKCLNLNRTLDPALSESFKQRFRDETKIAYRLSKGNLDIVRSISSGTLRSPTGGALIPYMVLEWLTGRSLALELKERVKDGRGPLTIQEVVLMLEPAVTAIAYAHEQGVVHRDIKPGNLFLAQTRDGWRVKVLDFGLAKILHPEAIVEPSQETLNGLYICSPSYGAPEQFSSKFGVVGPWSDVYSLTLVILELLSGKKARHAKNLQDAITKIADPALAEPTAARMGVAVSPAVDAVLRRGVASYAADRPKDATAFWGDLRDAMLESADDFATISNDQLPAKQMISDALAKVGVKRTSGDHVAVDGRSSHLPPPPSPPSPRGPGLSTPQRLSTAPAALPPPSSGGTVQMSGVSGRASPQRVSVPPQSPHDIPADRTVKLDRDQLEAFAKKDSDKHAAAPAKAPARGPIAKTVPSQKLSSGLRSSAPASVTWLWIVAGLALITSFVLLWQALRH